MGSVAPLPSSLASAGHSSSSSIWKSPPIPQRTSTVTLVLRADVSQDEHWHRVAREVDARFGRCDIVVNNAAYMKEGTIDQLDYATWRRGLAVNLDAHFLSAKHFVPRMRRNHWGRFVGIFSNSIGTPVQGLS